MRRVLQPQQTKRGISKENDFPDVRGLNWSSGLISYLSNRKLLLPLPLTGHLLHTKQYAEMSMVCMHLGLYICVCTSCIHAHTTKTSVFV